MRKRGWEKCVFLACLFMVAACGGGEGEESTAPATPISARVTLSDSTRDTSQGKVIIVDYQGPAVTSGSSVRATVGDTVVSGLFAGNSIYLTLPFSESGETAVSFDFGSFSASLKLDIQEAPEIENPRTYVAEQLVDLKRELAPLRSGGYQQAYDAVIRAEEQLADLSEEEIREFAVLFKQNLEPLFALEQTAGQGTAVRSEHPDDFTAPRFLVSQGFDSSECNEAVIRVLRKIVIIGLGVSTAQVTAAGPVGVVIAGVGVGMAIITLKKLVDRDIDALWASCLTPGIEVALEFLGGRRVTAKSLGYFPDGEIPRVAGASEIAAQDSEERLQFVDDIPRELAISQASRIRHDRREELLEKLSKIRELVVSANRVSGGLLQSLVDALDRYVERSAPADASSIRLSGITNDNITGTITAAESNKLTLKFEFANAEAVNSYVDFDFTLSSTIEGVDDVVVNGRLMPVADTIPGISSYSPLAVGGDVEVTVQFDPPPSEGIVLNYQLARYNPAGNSLGTVEAKTVSVPRGSSEVEITESARDGDEALIISLLPGSGYEPYLLPIEDQREWEELFEEWVGVDIDVSLIDPNVCKYECAVMFVADTTAYISSFSAAGLVAVGEDVEVTVEFDPPPTEGIVLNYQLAHYNSTGHFLGIEIETVNVPRGSSEVEITERVRDGDGVLIISLLPGSGYDPYLLPEDQREAAEEFFEEWVVGNWATSVDINVLIDPDVCRYECAVMPVDVTIAAILSGDDDFTIDKDRYYKVTVEFDPPPSEDIVLNYQSARYRLTGNFLGKETKRVNVPGDSSTVRITGNLPQGEALIIELLPGSGYELGYDKESARRAREREFEENTGIDTNFNRLGICAFRCGWFW